MDLPVKSQCRSCLAPETNTKKHVSIFEQDLQQVYTDLTQIHLLADSPYNNLCMMCSKLLQSFFEFRSQCLESNDYFSELEAKDLFQELEPEPEKPFEPPISTRENIKVEQDLDIEDEIPEEVYVEVEAVDIRPGIYDRKSRKESIDESQKKSPVRKRRKRENETPVPKAQTHSSDFFMCEHCPDKVFTNRQYYREHLKIHQAGTLECHFCGLKYRSKYFLLGHIDRKHLEKDYGKQGDFACTICPKRYLTKVRLKKHLGIHKVPKKPCPHCGELVKNLSSHMAVHNTTDRFQCDKCEKSYKSQQHLQIHAIVHENKTFNAFVKVENEEETAVSTYSENSLEQQEGDATVTVKQEEVEPESGDEQSLNPFRPKLVDEGTPMLTVECTKQYESWRLKMSQIKVEKSTVKYNCSLCPKSFSTPSGFRKHYIGIHNPSMKKFHCRCGRAFTTGSELKRHGIYFCKEKTSNIPT